MSVLWPKSISDINILQGPKLLYCGLHFNKQLNLKAVVFNQGTVYVNSHHDKYGHFERAVKQNNNQ